MPTNVDEQWFARSACGSKCRSTKCVRELNAVITKASVLQLKDYVWSNCPMSCLRHDDYGRYPLHFAAACGKIEIMDWLITTFQCELNVRDIESGWTALHKAIYYGRLACATLLIEYGADMWLRDKDGLTAMDIAMIDCAPWVKSLQFSRQTYEMPSVLGVADPSEIYTWGTNDNFVLGHGNPRGGKLPEPVEYFTKKKIHIKKVAMGKFHSVFLAADGTAFTCGHGEGGRLGNGQQDVCLEPNEVSLNTSIKMVDIAAGVNHTVLVTENGQVYACGLNKHHVLGVSTSNDRELIPVRIHGALKSLKVVGCAAAKLHTVLWTDSNAVFTFGTNAGQLGHSKADLFVQKPRQVSGVYSEEDEVISVHACDSSTVVATKQGTVYLLQNYICRKIVTKQLDIEKVQVGGGRLDTSALAQIDQRLHATHTQLKDDSLHVIMQKKSGDILSWSKARGTLDRCRFSLKQPFLFKDVSLCNHGHTALLVTNTGEAFIAKYGKWNAPKPPKKHSINSLSRGYDSCLDMLDADAVQEFQLEQVSGIFRAHSGALGPKGKGGALLQCEPRNFLTEVPISSESRIFQDLKSLFGDAHKNDGICDMVAIATDANGNKLASIPCHRYVLATRSLRLRKVIQENFGDYHDDGNNLGTNEDDFIYKCTERNLVFEKCDPTVLKNILEFIYCDSCELMRNGFKPPSIAIGTHSDEVKIYWSNNDLKVANSKTNPYKNGSELNGNDSAFRMYQQMPKSKKGKTSKNSAKNALSQFKSLARCLGVHRPWFDRYSFHNGSIVIKNGSSYTNEMTLSPYDRFKLRELCDIKLECSDGVVLEAHKCILAARVEFFRSMLFSQWAETASSVSKVPIPSKVFEHVLDFVYKDDSAVLDFVPSLEMLCEVMAAADQLLLGRLREIAEVQVASMLSLKNVSAVIEFSAAFNCDQLFKTCQQFICHNFSSLMHTPQFYSIDFKTLEECQDFYRENIDSVFLRIITPSTEAPLLPELESVIEDNIGNSVFEPSSPTESTFAISALAYGSPTKKKSLTGRRKSVAGKRKSSKSYGITLSELLAQKDEDVDTLITRITSTARGNNRSVPPTPEQEYPSCDTNGTNSVFDQDIPAKRLDSVEQKSILPVQEVGKKKAQPLPSPTIQIPLPSESSNGNPSRLSFRDIMASQARKPQPAASASVATLGNRINANNANISASHSGVPAVGRSKKLSQKERKRLELEASKKKSEAASPPNAWGVATSPPPAGKSFWDVMKEQSPSQPAPRQATSRAISGPNNYLAKKELRRT